MHSVWRILERHKFIIRRPIDRHVRVVVRTFTNRAYVHREGKDSLVYRNVGEQIQTAANKYAQRWAIVSCHEDKRLTFAEVKAEAEVLAVQLRTLGLQRGDHLAIWTPNTIQWYITFWAAALGGYPLACLNPALQAQETAYALRKANVKALVTMDEYGKQNFYNILKEILPDLKDDDKTIQAKNLPHLKRVVMKMVNLRKEFINFDDLLKADIRSHDIALLNVKVSEISPEAPCNIQFTSGTTGQPKAALLTHFSLINEGYYFGKYLSLHESHKTICLTMPLFHAYALSFVSAALNHGSTLVLPSATFNAAAALEAIEKEKCHVLPGTPTMFVDMVEHQLKVKKSLPSLQLGLVGGAACSPEVFCKVKSVLGLPDMRIGYGLTESTAATFIQDGSEPPERAVLSVGQLFEHGEAKVINDQGEIVAFGQPGELCLRGYFTMQGYFEDEGKTKEILTRDGWLRTGDEFILEFNGIGRIVGRKKDLIIRGGENIYPKEIEDFLDTHPDVIEAQVIGVSDERMGEEICAFVRLKPETKALTVDDVKKFCKGRIAHFKVPRYVRVVSDFPKTTSGKIQKFKLKEIFEKK